MNIISIEEVVEFLEEKLELKIKLYISKKEDNTKFIFKYNGVTFYHFDSLYYGGINITNNYNDACFIFKEKEMTKRNLYKLIKDIELVIRESKLSSFK